MQKVKGLPFLVVLVMAVLASITAYADVPTLGDAPRTPASVLGLPGGGPRPLIVTGGINVNPSSREQVREFYTGIYAFSSGLPMLSTADVANCLPGTNSTTFQQAVLLRINWFRAMAGLPASVTLDTGENAKDQSGALMVSANAQVQHTDIPPTWSCFTMDGTNAAANSNLALGESGPEAISGYIWDFGAANYETGHRRWILYPQTQVMGTGDIAVQGANSPANATWILDANLFGPRPATRMPYVAWPPSGYVPYQVVYPQWSFALSNAYLGNATVSLSSNGVNLPVTIQPYATGYGENTLVWYPTALDPSAFNTAFPFNGTDTVYTVGVSNIVTSAGTANFSYTVTVFDPGTPGTDYVATAIAGTNQPIVGASNLYTCAPAANPNVTGYQWLVSQSTNGYLFDGAEAGLVNFTTNLTAGYLVITNVTGETGNFCFYLAMPYEEDQTLQLNEWLLPATNAQVAFKSLLGYATTNQVAKVQVSTDGGAIWHDLYSQVGTGGAGQSSFTNQSLSLSNYAGVPIRLQFNYHYNEYGGGSIFTNVLTSPPVGWFLDNIVVTNVLKLVNTATNLTVSTNFTFVPAQTTNYYLQAQAVTFNQFSLDGGPLKPVAAVVGPPVIALGAPVIVGSQVQLNFTIAAGSASTFHLLQADQLGQAWATNNGALLVTNIAGSSYRFTTTNGPATRFYRVQTP